MKDLSQISILAVESAILISEIQGFTNRKILEKANLRQIAQKTNCPNFKWSILRYIGTPSPRHLAAGKGDVRLGKLFDNLSDFRAGKVGLYDKGADGGACGEIQGNAGN